jgi:predicted RNA binding protein YcfA (HicA-like mRNA interferase family)
MRSVAIWPCCVRSEKEGQTRRITVYPPVNGSGGVAVAGMNNLKPDRVIVAFERAGWENLGRYGKHYKLRKAGNPNILSVPVHGGKPIKAGLLRGLLKKAKLTAAVFLALYR